ncbi:nuclear transport factor 2 family protein [Microbacterium sp. ARD31]|uniref:nuclear transport factor 2 family protein n=1 Tax=Microbacterium sp. ARD31 TaxID=2962576 RepID=UPI00288131FE|nr:nuclear transport factor 2 family protein [Microbacterium sp. ARD31]MDT0183997.1 nuclear transport factor 2 family protein [Microbacterium sp. ARD31]
MSTTVSDFTTDVWERVDSLEVPRFAELFAEDGTLVFGNGEAMVGPAQIQAGVEGFFTTIKALHHTVKNEWQSGDTTVIELDVAYDRLDGKTVSIPVVSIWDRGPDGLFTDYRVFFDLAPVYA